MSLQMLPFELYTHILSFASPEDRRNTRLVCKDFYQTSCNKDFKRFFALTAAKFKESLFKKPPQSTYVNYLIDALGRDKIILACFSSKLRPTCIRFFSTKSPFFTNSNAQLKCSQPTMVSRCGEGVFLLKNFDENRKQLIIKVDALLNIKTIPCDPNDICLVSTINKGAFITFKDDQFVKNFSCFNGSLTNSAAQATYKLTPGFFKLKEGLVHIINDDIILFHQSPVNIHTSEPQIEINSLKHTNIDKEETFKDSKFPFKNRSYTISKLILPSNIPNEFPLKMNLIADKTNALLCFFKDNKIDNWHLLDLTGPRLISSVAHKVLEKSQFEDETFNYGLYEGTLILYTRKFNQLTLRSTLELTKFSADKGQEVNHTFLCPSHQKVSHLGEKYISIAKENYDNLKESATATYSIEVYDLKNFILRASFEVGKYRPVIIDFSHDSLTTVLENGQIVHFKRG